MKHCYHVFWSNAHYLWNMLCTEHSQMNIKTVCNAFHSILHKNSSFYVVLMTAQNIQGHERQKFIWILFLLSIDNTWCASQIEINGNNYNSDYGWPSCTIHTLHPINVNLRYKQKLQLWLRNHRQHIAISVFASIPFHSSYYLLRSYRQ